MKIHCIGLPRTGTTFLLELCHQHYDKSVRLDEPFNCHIWKDKKLYPWLTDTADIRKCIETNIQVIQKNPRIVVKNLVNELNTLQNNFPNLYRQFTDELDFSIKILRRDIISSSISLAYSLNTGDWTSNKNDFDRKKVTIDTQKFIQILDIQRNNQKTLREIKTDVTVLYEDMIQYPLETWNSFGIQPKTVLKTIYQTKNPPKEDYISNIDELMNIAESIVK